ncbi:MAG: hypothetical protein LBM13_06100 [Candidatus Ancillula sp.]|jgi:hypothetical protein|nr:hypothetical protein [Candidatus Ancillula sp.]
MGAKVKFQIEEIIVDKSMSDDLITAGWNFDWNDSQDGDTHKLAAYYKNELQGLVEFERDSRSLFNFIYLVESAPHNIGKTKMYEGVHGALFASVAKDSLDAGFEGFVVFEAKTVLINHYITKYGAKFIHGRRLVFDTEASIKLIHDYLGE